MGDEQWRVFGSRPWLAMSRPVYQYHRVRQEVENDVWRRFARSDSDSEADRADEAEKDWALECVHLFQHTHFHALNLVRRAPNRTSDGAVIRYHLPLGVQRVLIDQLTSARVYWALSGYRGIGAFEDPYFLHADYAAFQASATTASEPVTLRYEPDFERDHRGCVCGRKPPIPPIRTAQAAEARQDEAEEDVTEQRQLAPDSEATLRAAYSARHKWCGYSPNQLIVFSPELAVLGGRSFRIAGPEEIPSPLYCPSPRQTIRRHPTAGAKEKRGEDSASAEPPVVDVYLDSCPVVHYRPGNGDSLPVVSHGSVEAWLRQGAVERAPTAEEAMLVADLLAVEPREPPSEEEEPAGVVQRVGEAVVAAVRKQHERWFGMAEGRRTAAMWRRHMRANAAEWSRP